MSLTTVSLYVTLDGRQERESEIEDVGEFYDRLRASAEGVSTSQPSVGDFVAVYEPLLAEGMEIVSVHLSGGISGTVEAASPGTRPPDRRWQARRAGHDLRQPHGGRRAGARHARRRARRRARAAGPTPSSSA